MLKRYILSREDAKEDVRDGEPRPSFTGDGRDASPKSLQQLTVVGATNERLDTVRRQHRG